MVQDVEVQNKVKCKAKARTEDRVQACEGAVMQFKMHLIIGEFNLFKIINTC